jgi:hypothetical protein
VPLSGPVIDWIDAMRVSHSLSKAADVSPLGRGYCSYPAVEVPGMSIPQTGCDDTGTKPFFSACMTHEH